MHFLNAGLLNVSVFNLAKKRRKKKDQSNDVKFDKITVKKHNVELKKIFFELLVFYGKIKF